MCGWAIGWVVGWVAGLVAGLIKLKLSQSPDEAGVKVGKSFAIVEVSFRDIR